MIQYKKSERSFLMAKKKNSSFFTSLLYIIIGVLLIVFRDQTLGWAMTAAGVFFAKLINVFSKKKINPMIGATGISAFPMSARVVHKMGLQEDPGNFLLMHTIGVNVSGQIASVIAGGLILSLFAMYK